ncbi:MAG: hypothetical protein KC636_13180 [Myxococcales bacterium]|nr:hypothetical protein [Myxococcales bacterium]
MGWLIPLSSALALRFAGPVAGDGAELEAPARAEAARSTPARQPLRITDRRLFFRLFAGRSQGLFPYLNDAMKIEASIGGHGKRRRSLAGAFVLQVDAITQLPAMMTFAARLQWDKPLSDRYAIDSSTTFTLGPRLFFPSSDYPSGVYPAGMFAIGWGASMIVAERMLISLRPLDLDLTFPYPFYLSWSFMAGLGVVW